MDSGPRNDWQTYLREQIQIVAVILTGTVILACVAISYTLPIWREEGFTTLFTGGSGIDRIAVILILFVATGVFATLLCVKNCMIQYKYFKKHQQK